MMTTMIAMIRKPERTKVAAKVVQHAPDEGHAVEGLCAVPEWEDLSKQVKHDQAILWDALQQCLPGHIINSAKQHSY